MTPAAGRPRILVVGSYVEAFTMEVPRMPGDGETVIGWGARQGPGGKGSNQAIQAARLGAEVSILARVGADGLGDGARRLWREEGLSCGLVESVADLPTGVGYIMLDPTGQNRIVVDPGANACLGAAQAREAEAVIAASGLVLAQLEPPVEVVEEAFRISRRHGVMTLLNPAPARPLTEELWPLIDVLTPNLSEARALTGLPEQGFDTARAARALRSRGVGIVVVTLEEQGAWIEDGAGGRRLPGRRVEVVDSTGAGDAFTGALAVELAGGRPIDLAVARANLAGAFCVTRMGVVPGLGRPEDLASIP